jgi:hypothetical protein
MTLQCGVVRQLTQAREIHHVTMNQTKKDDLSFARSNDLSFGTQSTESNKREHVARKIDSSPSTSHRNVPLHTNPPAASAKEVILPSDRFQMSSLGIGLQVPLKSDIIFGRGGG